MNAPAEQPRPDFLAELTTATSGFAALVGLASGAEPVPACPGWTVRDLTVHLGTMHRWAAGIVLSGQRLREPTPLVTEPIDRWYAGTVAALFAALRAVDPEESVENFSRIDQTAAFWPRRQVHETVVHAVDVRQALGQGHEDCVVAAPIAADGIDEVLRIYFPRLTATGRRPDVRARIRLTATDLGRSWIVAPGQDESAAPVQLPGSGDADAVVTGTASDLYLSLWHRAGLERLQIEGQDAVAMMLGDTTA